MNTETIKQIGEQLTRTEEEATQIHGTVSFADGGKTVVLAANREGLVYLASILLSLAEKQVDQSHHHFDRNTLIEALDPELVIKFEKAP